MQQCPHEDFRLYRCPTCSATIGNALTADPSASATPRRTREPSPEGRRGRRRRVRVCRAERPEAADQTARSSTLDQVPVCSSRREAHPGYRFSHAPIRKSHDEEGRRRWCTVGPKTDQLSSQVIEAAGSLTGDKDLESEGTGDGRAAEAKENLDHAKGKIEDAVEYATALLGAPNDTAIRAWEEDLVARARAARARLR
jgi:uncharacterized protein YjbJ (UPF0337 family)